MIYEILKDGKVIDRIEADSEEIAFNDAMELFDGELDDIREAKPARTPEQIKADGEEAYKQMMADIGKKQGSDLEVLKYLFPRTSKGGFSQSVVDVSNAESVGDLLGKLGKVPVEAVMSGIGTGLDFASVPGRLARSSYAINNTPADLTPVEVFTNTMEKTTGDNIGSSILVDPLTFITMGSPTGRIIDTGIYGLSKAGNRFGKKVLDKAVDKLTAPTWKSAFGTGAGEAAIQGGLSAYDRPVNATEAVPSVIANTLIGRYGYRGPDLMKEAEKAAYRALTPKPSQIKANPKLGDVRSIGPLLDKNILATGKDNTGHSILANIKNAASDIGDRQDAIRYGKPTETNVFSSTRGSGFFDQFLDISMDMSVDEQKAFMQSQPELAALLQRSADRGVDEKIALNYIAATVLDRSPYKEQLIASGIEKVPRGVLEELRASTMSRGENNILNFGTEERRVREKLLSNGGDLYNDLKDLVSAGVVEDGNINKNINSIIDYRRKLSKIADAYGSFDKPTAEQTAKAKIYREAVDVIDKHINNLTSPENLDPLLYAMTSPKYTRDWGKLFESAEGGLSNKQAIADRVRNDMVKLTAEKDALIAPESKRIADFRSTQQEFADILPWRDVVESHMGRLNADRPSLIDEVRNDWKQNIWDGVTSQATGAPNVVGMNTRKAQSLYSKGKKQILPKKTLAQKSLEIGAKNLLAPDAPYEGEEAPPLHMLVRGGSVPVRTEPVTKQWADVDEMWREWKKNQKQKQK